MFTAKISEYRSHISDYHKRVLDNREPLRVVGGARGDVVVIPADDFESLQETIEILKDRATMNSLLEGRSDFAEAKTGGSPIGEVFADVVERENR